MASPLYMWIENEQGNPVEGSVVNGDERQGSIEVLSLSHSVEIPTDVHSGSLNGMRRHNAVKFTKAIDKSSTELFQAVTTGKTLKKVLVRFYKIDPEGQEAEYYRIEYEDAKITNYETELRNVKDPNSDRVPHLENIEMRYKKMIVTFAEGNLTHSDSWEERKGRVA